MIDPRIPIQHVELVKDYPVPYKDRVKFIAPSTIEQVRHLFAGAPNEEFWVLLLDTANTITGAVRISTGSINASIVRPAQVFAPAIIANCASIICVHNHPSGNPNPSAEDKAITTTLVEAGSLLSIMVLDHIIITDDTFTSMRETGMWPE